jgi:DUF1009 family protein
MGESLGLVAGSGGLPALMAREARRAGWRVVALALGDPGALAPVADRVEACRVGDVAAILGVLGEEGIRHVVLAGKVWKDGLLRGGAALDTEARALLGRSADWTDTALLRTAEAALAGLGITLLDQRAFLGAWLAPAGHLAGPPLAPGAAADVERGLELARELARRDVGQTVVLREGAVTAVEAAEGTDAAVRRGLALAGPGGVVVKAASPAQDYRFDVPAIGPATAALAAEGRAAALAVEAGRVLVVEREEVEALAARAGLTVVGVAGLGGSA